MRARRRRDICLILTDKVDDCQTVRRDYWNLRVRRSLEAEWRHLTVISSDGNRGVCTRQFKGIDCKWGDGKSAPRSRVKNNTLLDYEHQTCSSREFDWSTISA